MRIRLPEQQLPSPTRQLSREFLRIAGQPAILTTPSKLALAAADFSGRRNTGSLNGGVTVQPSGYGALGAAWQFDGSSSSVINLPVSDHANLPGLTFSALLKFASQPSGMTAYAYTFGADSAGLNSLSFAGPIGGFTGSNLQVNTGGETWSSSPVTTRMGPTYGSPSVVGSFFDWHLYTVVADGTTLWVYIDGGLYNSFACATALGIFSQASSDRAGFQANAAIGCFAYWFSALSASQVAALHRSLVYGDPPLFAPRFAELPDAAPASSTSGLLLARRRFVA